MKLQRECLCTFVTKRERIDNYSSIRDWLNSVEQGSHWFPLKFRSFMKLGLCFAFASVGKMYNISRTRSLFLSLIRLRIIQLYAFAKVGFIQPDWFVENGAGLKRRSVLTWKNKWTVWIVVHYFYFSILNPLDCFWKYFHALKNKKDFKIVW